MIEKLEKISKELEEKLSKQEDKDSRISLIYRVLYSVYVDSFSLKKDSYTRVDEKYPLKRLREP